MAHQPRFRKLIAGRTEQNRSGSAASGAAVFDALVHARGDDVSFLTDDEIADHVFTMLVAGVDRTALALSWALYWIHEDLDVRCRLREEIDGLGPGAGPDRIAQLQRVCGYRRESENVSWMPNLHDYGLVEGLLEPLYDATPC